MASGLPIAFPNRREMPEFLGNFVVYFDSEQPVKVDHDLYEMIESPLYVLSWIKKIIRVQCNIRGSVVLMKRLDF
jgi:hypothetical protein